MAIGDNNNALAFFNKALQQDPDNTILSARIGYIERELQNKAALINNDTGDKRKIKISETKPTSPKINNKESNNEMPAIWLNSSDWIFNGLQKKDFKVNDKGITFFSSNEIKKLISQRSMTDINIEVDLKFNNVSANTDAGIIVGYNASGKTNNESYFLFKVENNGNFTLLSIKDSGQEILKTFNSQFGLYNDNKELRIKLTSLGPWIILYLDDKLLGSWYGEDFIKGKIGLFSGSKTSVEFISFKLSSAFKKEK